MKKFIKLQRSLKLDDYLNARDVDGLFVFVKKVPLLMVNWRL